MELKESKELLLSARLHILAGAGGWSVIAHEGELGVAFVLGL